MKNIFIKTMLLSLLVLSMVSCKKYLNINSDPDTTQNPSNSSVFPAMLSGIPRGVQFDARYMSKYVQNLLASANGNADTWDRHGFLLNSDASGDIWRQTYFGLGANLNYIIKNGVDKEQYDYAGASLVLKALMFQMATDYHGEIIFNEAFKEGTYYFKYDSQQVVYQGVDSLCRLADQYLQNAQTKTVTMGNSDISFNGNITKWRKLNYSILAKNFHRLTNKAGLYKADSVIKYCDLAMASVDDDFVIPFDASKNDDANFYGTYRNNLTLFRQSNFIVKLLDGTTIANTGLPADRDPRMAQMLTRSQDTTNGNGGYRGVDPGNGDPFSALTGTYAVNSANWINARKRVSVVWGDSIYANPSSAVFTLSAGKYLFRDKAVMPVITYAEMQFIKAEAAYRMGQKTLAHTAYLNGINAHFDFINKSYSANRGNASLFTIAPISATNRSKYLASNNVKSATTITITDIMLQKYIALWGYGFLETWVDMRRFHYIDADPETGDQVYKNFSLPSSYYVYNNNKPVYRVRPRFNSEYVWNLEQLKTLGATNLDYHTYECWFSKP
ncbi:SusD/RagB family nutrient-binding outer membrane lipoprotein [Ferruginibacter sp.]|nr:SusD/RagB family nutrient-binding outer membrane lipoprotein [Ferruginibacter sp.]